MRIQELFWINFLIFSISANAQSIMLPSPSGRFAVGTDIYERTNYGQPDSFSVSPNDFRRIPIQIWYPTKDTAGYPPARYAPLFSGTDSVLPNAHIQSPVYSNGKKIPVLIICPGRGMSKHEYTVISEDLASRGYFVVSIDMPYIGFSRYTNGQVIRPASQFRMPSGMISGPYEKVDSFYTHAAHMGSQDIGFILKELASMNEDDKSGFAGLLDLENIGIFGHSLGGRIAGQALADYRQIKCYLSMEGIAPRDIRVNGLNKPMGYMLSESLMPNAIANYNQALPNRKSQVVIIVLKSYAHNSFTDLLFTYPESFKDHASQEESLRTNRQILAGFFDEHLRGGPPCKDVWTGNPLIMATWHNAEKQTGL